MHHPLTRLKTIWQRNAFGRWTSLWTDRSDGPMAARCREKTFYVPGHGQDL